MNIALASLFVIVATWLLRWIAPPHDGFGTIEQNFHHVIINVQMKVKISILLMVSVHFANSYNVLGEV